MKSIEEHWLVRLLVLEHWPNTSQIDHTHPTKQTTFEDLVNCIFFIAKNFNNRIAHRMCFLTFYELYGKFYVSLFVRLRETMTLCWGPKWKIFCQVRQTCYDGLLISAPLHLYLNFMIRFQIRIQHLKRGSTPQIPNELLDKTFHKTEFACRKLLNQIFWEMLCQTVYTKACKLCELWIYFSQFRVAWNRSAFLMAAPKDFLRSQANKVLRPK